MFEPLRHLMRGIAGGRLPAHGSPPTFGNGDEAGPVAANPLTRINRAAQDVLAAVGQQLDATRRVDDGLREIEEQVSRAWRERDSLTRDYYAALRGVLRVLDDCQALSTGSPGLPAVLAALEKLLHEQAVEPIPITVGDRFQAETQCCEQTEASAAVPPGTVLRVLAVGYRRRLADGMAAIVRPARVVVSQAAGESQESRP
jgi:molecular chaperone GrpE (heat shock protein)